MEIPDNVINDLWSLHLRVRERGRTGENGGTGSLFESVALQSCFTNNRSQQ